MKKYLVLFVALLAAIAAKAVTAIPEPMSVTQPDGTTLQVSLHGDELAHYTTTSDGYLVAESASGFQYATFAADDALQLSGVVAHNASQRTAAEQQFVASLQRVEQVPSAVQRQHVRQRALHQQAHAKSYPLKGSPHSLVILVEFSNKKFTISDPQAKFTALLNESGYSENGGTGSARDYFIAASDSAFSPIFDVYGPYTLPEKMEYYGGNSGTGSSARTDENASVMIKQAVSLACEAGVDFTPFDTDGDGVLDNVFVYYAGFNEAEGGGENTVWPHRSQVANSPEYCGKTVYDYACTSELRGYAGKTMCGIGTFCHEFGHVLGLPDLYDTGNSDAYTVGSWDIMCSGSYNNAGRTPPSYSSYERFFLGWLDPIQIEAAGNYTLSPLTTSNSAYLLAAKSHNMSGSSPNPNEFFLLENRQNVGWDAGANALVGTGMLVWHIKYSSARWRSNAPNNDGDLGVDIVEAYSKKATSSLASDAFPGTRNVTNLDPTLSDGTSLGLPLSGIRQLPDSTISFALAGGEGTGFSFDPEILPDFVSTIDVIDYRTYVDYAVNEVHLLGTSLSPTDTISVQMRGNFQISLDSVEWATSIKLMASSDSVLNQRVWLRYAPTRQNCTTVSGALTIQNSEYVNSLALSGRAPNSQRIVVPTIDSVTGITPYSVRVSCEPQSEATAYYLTLYRINDVRSEVPQLFDDFTSLENIREAGWDANFVSSSTAFKSASARSIYFTETGNTLWSEKYPMGVTELDFWVTANYTGSGDTIGGALLVSAFDGEQWYAVDSIGMKRTSKNLSKSYQFDLDKNYVQFRFTYQHGAGKGGVALDNFVVTFDKQITYLYRGEEKELYVGSEENPDSVVFYISDLQPNTEYYCQVQCTDLDKGCEEHLTELSEPLLIKTLDGTSSSGSKLTVAYENGEYVVYVPQADMDRYIFVYDVRGILIEKIAIESTLENRIVLPRLLPNNFYVLKYSEEGRHKRKDKWAKLFYQEF